MCSIPCFTGNVCKQACAFLMQQLRQEGQNKSKTWRRKEIINRKAKFNENENRNQQSKSMKQKVVFFFNQLNCNPLAILTKRKIELLISEMKQNISTDRHHKDEGCSPNSIYVSSTTLMKWDNASKSTNYHNSPNMKKITWTL